MPDLGLWALDRGEGSCVWKTGACHRCYNRDLIIYFPWLWTCWKEGGADDRRWAAATPETFKGLDRVRLCTRGEPFATLADVSRVATWIRGNPDTLFWITTRCWQRGIQGDHRLNSAFLVAIEEELLHRPNARITASMDPYTIYLLPFMQDRGWSTNYFGSERPHPSDLAFRCPKTWRHAKGICGVCQDGCFSGNRVDIWFKEHGSHLKPTPQLDLGLFDP